MTMTGFEILPQDAAQLHNLADAVGTPFYVYDAAAIRGRYRALTRALPQAQFFYSLKANPNLSLVGLLVAQGSGTEVSSRLELETALAAGCPADQILMVGPGKAEDDLERAVSLGLKAIVAESLPELEQINRIAARAERTQPIAMRVNPDFKVSGARLNMSGRPTQFGIDECVLDTALRRVEDLHNLRLAGLHVYMGTRILSHDTILANTCGILELAARVARDLAAPLEFVDIGGGYGVPYYEDESALDLNALGSAMQPLLSAFAETHPDTRIAIELGRYMVAEAGRFVTSVRQVKANKGENFAVCDGGSNVHSAAAGQGFMRRNFPVSLVPHPSRSNAADGPDAPWSITGPLCTPMDVIAKDVALAPPAPGDLICIHQSGAYGATASPVNFLGFGAPVEVMVDEGTATVVRERPRVQGFLDEQIPRPISILPAAPHITLPAPFDHPALERLEDLRTLFETTGGKLAEDPDAWRDLWADPLVKALTMIGVPEAYNGFPLAETSLGLERCPHDLHVALVERLARFDAGCILALQGPSLAGGALEAVGTPAQQERFFSAYRSGPQGTFFAVTEPDVGSDASAGATVLETSGAGYVLRGSKMLIGNVARARIGIVYARFATSGRSALVLIEPEKVADHLTITRLPTTGMSGADLCRLDIHDVPVGHEDLVAAQSEKPSLRDGFMAINGVFERYRPVVAALALGNARGMLDRLSQHGQASAFAGEYRTHSALIAALAEICADGLRGRSRGHRISEVKFQAVAFSDALAARIARDAPAAMLTDPLLRRKIRDAKGFEYMEGTSNIHMLNAYRTYVAGVAS
ncbi:acyl-CoA dehydrogenase family protein [Epibacterium sp. MM17-32]|uniref:acyl-CoA dehydrogenase family protein n=1 Tax=Epibacterium sp. MM17-32 TaxID=2917734 RepID=UPI001EF6F4AC|nr:acyl-CoA dehydrogenase family protein [Epibacterium sp. MM17-32]MCG7626764.1 acyl-CoA dehydrogenase family protein [Epibacterium sp. MM17-32]